MGGLFYIVLCGQRICMVKRMGICVSLSFVKIRILISFFVLWPFLWWLLSCGVKGDPQPPEGAFDWGGLRKSRVKTQASPMESSQGFIPPWSFLREGLGSRQGDGLRQRDRQDRDQKRNRKDRDQKRKRGEESKSN